MERYEWDNSWNLGIDVIDAQHRQIVSYINELNHAIAHEDSDEVFAVLERLRDYTFDHFTFEEQLLEQSGYVLLSAHQAVHRRFEEKVKLIQEDLTQGRDPVSVARKVRTWLMAWLIQHIQHEDADYVPYVKKVLNQKTGWIGSALNRIFGTSSV